jgi:hypothetical protein
MTTKINNKEIDHIINTEFTYQAGYISAKDVKPVLKDFPEMSIRQAIEKAIELDSDQNSEYL